LQFGGNNVPARSNNLHLLNLMGHGGLHLVGLIPTPPYSGLGMRLAVGWPCGHVNVQLAKLQDSSHYM